MDGRVLVGASCLFPYNNIEGGPYNNIEGGPYPYNNMKGGPYPYYFQGKGKGKGKGKGPNRSIAHYISPPHRIVGARVGGNYSTGSSQTRAKALFCSVLLLHFLLLGFMGDLSYPESFCGVLCLLFSCTLLLPESSNGYESFAWRSLHFYYRCSFFQHEKDTVYSTIAFGFRTPYGEGALLLAGSRFSAWTHFSFHLWEFDDL